tara:strand:- start:215 stop:1243 length:1029 start_codon:yes stop_codon:yes gene_type:complete
MPNNIELCYSKSNTYPVNPNNEQVFATFQQDNPHINGAFVSAGTPFIMRSGNTNGTNWRQERPELVCTLNQIQSLPQQAKRNIALMDDMFGGENLQALADFYQAELAPMLRNESIGAIGAASTALDTRLSNFAKAANKLQDALEKVRIGAQAKYPKAQMMMLEQNARELGKDFNQKFQAEINKYIGRVKSKRGTVYSNADRGINKAKSGRSIKPIQFTSTVDFQNLRAFEMGANVLGKGLIVLDAGIRVGNVHVDYLAGANWQKRAAVETAGFGLSTAAGLATGAAIVEAGLGIALLATPVGWVIIIGTAVTVGYVAAKGGDSIGQWVANEAYNIGDWLNSL